MNKHILYISYDGLTDSLGQSQILPYVIGLSKEYHFTIISAEKSEVYEQGKETIQEICREHNIDWKPLKYTKKPPIISTINDIRNLQKTAFDLHRQKQFAAVHCRSYISALVGLKMQQKIGIKFIFDMRGFWADERVDGKIWDLSKPHYKMVYRYFKKKERQFLDKADAIVVLTHSAKKILQDEWQVKKPVYVIPCAVDTRLFKPDNSKLNNSKLNNSKFKIQNSKLILGYLGSIGTWYMLDEMLDFFKVLLQTYPHAKFKFITKENPSVILQKAILKNIDTQRIIVKSATRNEVPQELQEIDLGIFFIKPVFSKQASSPVKQGEMMAMGIPVVTNAGVGDTDAIIEKYRSGLLVREFTEAEYKRVVNDIGTLLQADRSVLLKGADTYFSLTQSVDTYMMMYQNLLNA